MSVRFETAPDGARIAYERIAARGDGRGPGVIWLGGFRSTMDGTKASALAEHARGCGRGYLRFDYSGHGRSDGDFGDGTVGRWTCEAAHLFDSQSSGRQILVGSSMGAWIALLVARRHLAEVAEAGAAGSRIAGLVLIAPAVDMTERLIWAGADAAARRAILEEGVFQRPSAYGDGPYPITQRLIEDGREHLMLDGDFDPGCPVRILHGLEDADVPWRHGLEVLERLGGADARMTLVKHGDHRLSRPADITLLVDTVETLARQIEGG